MDPMLTPHASREFLSLKYKLIRASLSMASFLIEAFKGMEAEWNSQPSLVKKLSRSLKMALILFGEVFALFGLIPYALRCQSIYRSLPDLDEVKVLRTSSDASRHLGPYGVCLKKDISYDKEGGKDGKHRRLLDIYAPTSMDATSLPVVVFIHGGVWASGERYHYAPLATRLAQEGYIVAVPSYSLYPNVLVPAMVLEVSDAISWVQDHVSAFGGDKENIILAGHSAGAHLAAMVILARIAASSILSSNLVQGVADSRMPSLLICMAGVYHISRHFEFEKARDVHELSMMKRAVGGFAKMGALSPISILSGQQETSTEEPSYYKSFELFGEAIPRRLSSGGQSIPAEPPLVRHPATVVFSSLADHMVPFHESAEYVAKLHQRKVIAQHLIYNHTRHGDFATAWWPTRRGHTPKPLPPFASDLVKVLRRSRSKVRPVAATALKYNGNSQLSKM